MEQSYYWNVQQENHPKNRLLKYAKGSKISRQTLQTLLRIRKRYRRLPPIIYSLQDREENDEGIDFQNRRKKRDSLTCLFLRYCPRI